MIKHFLIVAGLAFVPFACSDDEEGTEEAVGVPGESGDPTSMGDPAMPDPGLGADTSPSLNDLAGAEAMPADIAPQMGEGEGAGSGMYVKSYVLRVRSGPGLNHSTVGYLTFNNQVNGTDNGPHWFKIGEGKYVSKKFLSQQKNAKPWAPAH